MRIRSRAVIPGVLSLAMAFPCYADPITIVSFHRGVGAGATAGQQENRNGQDSDDILHASAFNFGGSDTRAVSSGGLLLPGR
jgi:hypothetical protein